MSALATRSEDKALSAVETTAGALILATNALPNAVEALRQCHFENPSNNPDYLVLRNRLTKYALVFKEHHLHECEELVRKTKMQLRMFKVTVSFEAFIRHIDAYVKVAENNAKYAQLVVEKHIRLQTNIQKVGNDAKEVVEKLEKEYKIQLGNCWRSSKKAVEGMVAAGARASLYGLSSIAFAAAAVHTGGAAAIVGSGYAALMGMLSKISVEEGREYVGEKCAEASAARKEAYYAKNAEKVIDCSLQTAVKHLLSAIEKLTKGLKLFQEELHSCAETGHTMAKGPKEAEVFFGIVKDASENLMGMCDTFCCCLPKQLATLETLKDFKTGNSNDLQIWLKEHNYN